MKLNELLGVKKFTGMTSDEIVNFLRELGGTLKPLGRGSNAVALTNGTDVYKFWMLDSAYDSFIEYCQKNQDNPFLPKLKSKIKKIPAFFLRHRNAPDYINYIKIEKLEFANSRDMSIEVSPDSSVLINVKDIAHIVVRSKGDMSEILKAIAEFTVDEDDDGNVIKTDNLSDEIKLLAKTINDIYNIKVAGDFILDIESRNVMRRNGQLVILDPLANSADLRLNQVISNFARSPRSVGKAGVTTKTTS